MLPNVYKKQFCIFISQRTIPESFELFHRFLMENERFNPKILGREVDTEIRVAQI
jgi:hypothetical protein